MSRRFAIAAAGSVFLHALVLVCLARLEAPAAPASIGRKVDGAIAVELLGAASLAGAGTPIDEGSGMGAAPASPGPSREGSGSTRAQGSGERPRSTAPGFPRDEAEAAARGPAIGAVDPETQAADEVAASVVTEPASTRVGAKPGDGSRPGHPEEIDAASNESSARNDVIAQNSPHAAPNGSRAPISGNGANSTESRLGRGANGPGANGPGAGGPGAGEGAGDSSGSAGSGSAPDGIAGAAWSKLEAHLRAHAARCYPPAARRRAIQGGAEIRFCIGANGEPTGIRLEKSSGSSLLDRAAIDCVLRDAAPLPGPRGCASVPVWFRL